MATGRQRPIANLDDLIAHDTEIDLATCGVSLVDERETRFMVQGAHDASPTFYFVLEELFRHFDFNEHSHLLDVGCSSGRVLAHFARMGYKGQATGVELDPDLASIAADWSQRYPNIHVIQGSALDLDLNRYTDFYLFNPFAPWVLQKFLTALEQTVSHPITVVHMADNGDTWQYVGRRGWTEQASGEIESYRNTRGYPIKAYDNPQHYSIWQYSGNEYAL
jgi:SAM-dependent methyltransferase